ncbi:antitoxin Xre/MbcA/ParS toxin-binding domain-containing protein [Pseudomonas sp. SED1]|uniref:antitoxin Xre/MbcA/ParS toxin-binding domain-containing protein n=1 Tax=Pseudomonas sp. SED1 TaxID=3056845 RepID=UPI00296E3117|nr:antitoxin Xre/MbcA/ParS toxin-binding domain-containing protein [Pseudomonas sp. SED1]MDY0835281.1 antitoxin Xre/MbcA/ParS toxin-binding domain-containing protein [Pseudomonas sp. SED1]
MSETERWIVKCLKTEDGSGDIIIDLPQELLDQMGLGVGDDLELTVANGTAVLTPVHNATSVRPMFAGVLRDDAYHAYRKRLEAYLHISSNASDQDIHDMIVAGFSAGLITLLCANGTISPQERDRIIHPKTLKTKLAGNQLLTLDESDRLFRFAHITAMAEIMFGDEGKAKQWLSKPKARFLGKSPSAMVTTSHGTHLVEEMLIQVSEGISF